MIGSAPRFDDTTLPQLSIVIAIKDAGWLAASCMDSLCAQVDVTQGALEFIVVDGSPGGVSEEFELRYPDAILLRSPVLRSLPILHGLGIDTARGDLVAISEGHCTFSPEWAAVAIASHRATDSPVIGGAVEPGERLNALDWALYFCDYGQFLLPLPARPTHDLPGNNVILKRAILDQRIDFSQKGFWKTFFCQRLMAEGHTLLMEPRLVIRYGRHIGLTALIQRRYHHGRCFGAMRASQAHPLRRLVYVLTGPVLPWLLILKLVHRVWPKGRYRARFLVTLPWSCVILIAWSVGEWTGNVFGAGQSCSSL